MIDVVTETIQSDQAIKYILSLDGSQLTFVQLVQLWIDDGDFRSEFNRVLADAPFTGFRWETPPVSRTTIDQPFEFVLLNAPSFSSRQTDAKTYREYFEQDEEQLGVVAFANLRGDATLVAPCPQSDEDAYGHLAAFVRKAPRSQIDNFWRLVGESVQIALRTGEPIWLNTAGGGVAWLHVRLDSRPKYYGHAPYKLA